MTPAISKSINLLMFIFVVALALYVMPARSDDVPPSVTKVIERFAPGIQPDEVKLSPLPSFYQVLIDAQVLYVSTDGKHVLLGDVINTQDNINYTENLRRKNRLLAVGRVKTNLVSYIPKKERYQITVLTDIDCGYCRKFHQHMPELLKRGVRVDYLITPFRGPDAYQKAISVWCAADRNAAMDKGKAGKNLKEKKCDHPIEANLKVARALGTRGTPAIILETGDVIPGYVPPDKLLENMNHAGIQPRS